MTYYELLQALKPYHSFIYTGDKLRDLDLIEEDVKELRRLGLIEQAFFRDAMLVISKERHQLLSKREG
ncbi:YqgQ family protein [Salisediminibacterium beveridgei]|uniref:DUF910 family protein n=1 Tax=Salisediminibacterium beveridgei TaxID=632773 RepID=A0A1D7QUE7_9BACI|nr:YqgQ family protein [Salisediminibacterium beveridgei]AOM82634.1 hypothetical protein BBEV_1269 [Salisediminibacterium beveridgei]